MNHDLRAHFGFLSHANELVNESLANILLANGHVLAKPLSGFFPHINAILAHIYVADVLWTADIAYSVDSPMKPSIAVGELPQYDTFTINSLQHFLEQRRSADRQLVVLVNELREDDLPKLVSDYDAPSTSGGHPAWKALQHVFNHQTHHRGQISMALESFGIEHAYSDLIRLDLT